MFAGSPPTSSRFRAAALLLENEQRLVELRIALANFFAKDRDLGMLAAQAQDRRACNIRVVNVAGDEAAEIVGVLARSAATAFVQQKSDAVDVLEQAAARGWGRIAPRA